MRDLDSHAQMFGFYAKYNRGPGGVLRRHLPYWILFKYMGSSQGALIKVSPNSNFTDASEYACVCVCVQLPGTSN